jgi:GNAT superfamily N-acetyltransferase
VNSALTVELQDFTCALAPQVKEVASASWHQAYSGIYSRDHIDRFIAEYYSVQALCRCQDAVSAGDEFFKVAIVGGKVVGFCHMGASEELYWLYRLYLLPGYQRSGIGSIMLSSGQAWLRSRHAGEYFAVVHQGNKIAMGFYRKKKFTVYGPAELPGEVVLRKTLRRASP